MKKLRLLALLCLFAGAANAQNAAPGAVKFPGLDPSPADLLYYPVNATKVKLDDTSIPVIRIIYSRPQKKGREIFGALEKYDVVWRLGANESTEITFNKDVTFGDKKIKAGTYSFFAIPSKDKWTLILNKKLNRWGAFTYEESKDVARVTVPVKTTDQVVEALSMTFTDRADGATLFIAWDKTQVEVPISFAK